MSLTIHGSHAGDIWFEVDGELDCVTPNDLAHLREQVRRYGTGGTFLHALDESDVTALIQALTGPQLDDCADCEGPGLVNIEGRIVCPGHAAGFGLAEDEAS